MIKALVSLDADLASSIVLRYACRLTERIEMNLQTMHVEEVDQEGYPPGSGWVRSTWEKGLLQTAQEEIAQLLNAEKPFCPPLDDPKISIGEREEELLRELEDEGYDVFMEGVLYSFNATNFFKKVQSKLYRYAPCPIILVKNLVNVEKVALLLEDHSDWRPLVSAFLKIFHQSDTVVDLIHLTFQKTGRAHTGKSAHASPARPERAKQGPGEAARALMEKGGSVEERWVIQESPAEFGASLEDYGLVGACISRDAGKKSRIPELLGRVPSAVLLCRQ